VQVWTYYGNDRQQWKIQDAGDGFYHIYVMNNYPKYLLDMSGTNVQVWSNAANDRQEWQFQAVANNIPPSVAIAIPKTSFIAPAAIFINAVATDIDGTIAKVEFYNGTTLIGTSSTYPYSFTLTNVAAGMYTIKAKATDNKGAVSFSNNIDVKVTDPVIVTKGIQGLTTVAIQKTYNYTLILDTIKAEHIQWWVDGASDIVVNANDAKTITVSFPYFMEGVATSLHAGINYTTAPYYEEYSIPIIVNSNLKSYSSIDATIYPVQYQNTTTVTTHYNQNIQSIVVYNLLGQLVERNDNINSTSYKLGEELSNGVYIVQIFGSNSFITLKMYKGE
jgi:hypothetical protein